MRKLMVMVLFMLAMLSFTGEEYNTSKVSYYGIEHHGKKMSNGKRFNMYELTAAHKTLKFGTKVEVINTANDKSVIVEITDRGPFIKSRDLDLSQGAFSKIAKISTGVIKVKYKILD